MKTGKMIGRIIAVIFVVGAAWGGYSYWKFYTGSSYYTIVNSVGQEKEDMDDNGNKQGINYVYDLKSYNKEGEEKNVHFQTISGRPLRQGAYLKLKVNDSKGVLSFEEVQKNEVPEKALSQLN